jgi:hypothetical protein
MFRNLFISLFIISILIIINGCGSSKVDLSKTDQGDTPEWFSNPPSDSTIGILYSAKTASSRDLQMAIDKAAMDARIEISRQVEAQVQGLQKKFIEETGLGQDSQLLSQMTGASKTVTNQSLSGSTITKNVHLKDGDTFRAYVLVEYRLAAAKKLFASKIKANEELYTRVRSSESFKELENEIEKLDKK